MVSVAAVKALDKSVLAIALRFLEAFLESGMALDSGGTCEALPSARSWMTTAG